MTKRQDAQVIALFLSGLAFDWAREDFWPWRWIVPTVLFLLACWTVVLEEDTWQETAKAIRVTVLKPNKRKAFLRALLRAAERAALIGMIAFFVWSSAVRWKFEHAASHLSLEAEEFWKAQCLGLKASKLIGNKFEVGKEFFPQISELTPQTQREIRKIVIQELKQKRIIKDTPWIRKSKTSETFDSTATPFGKQLCNYYLTTYTPPKKEQQPPSAQTTKVPPMNQPSPTERQ